MAQCEIEIKSLLGSSEKAKETIAKLYKFYPDTNIVSKNKQLNHYFIGGDINQLYKTLTSHFLKNNTVEFKNIILSGENFSIRTRFIDENKLIFVVKASLDEGSSHNTISRLEFESEIKGMTLHELDQIILNAEFEYQAKWSREREEHKKGDINICFDKNAGYGYLAEFEKVIYDEKDTKNARSELYSMMEKLGVEELSQERLERMFAYYNENWPEYYGTEKIFVIK